MGKMNKGIISAIINASKEDFVEGPPLDYTYEQFEKDCEEIFSTVPEGPRLVMCLKCGDTVKSDRNCSCGYIGEIFEKLLKDE